MEDGIVSEDQYEEMHQNLADIQKWTNNLKHTLYNTIREYQFTV